MNTKVLTAHVPVPLVEQVDRLANQLERSRGWVVKQALTAWVAEAEHHHQLTLEALQDVDAENTLSQQAMQAWADSLSTDKPLKHPVLIKAV
jgi:predicted transcriptional regulator